MTALQQDFILEVLDRPAGSTTTPIRLGYLRAVSELRYRRGIDNNEWARFRVPADRFPTWLRSTHVVRATIIGDATVSGAFEEFRIERLVREGQNVTVECRGLVDDLTMCGPVYKEVGNDRLYTFTDTMTVAQWVAFLRTFHRARGFLYWDVGTITPTDTVTLTLDRQTPRQVLETLTNGGAQIGLWEYRYEYDPATGTYKLHIVQQYNSSVTALRVIGGQNLQSIVDEERAQDFLSGVVPSGGLGETAAARSIAQSLWKVSSVSTSPAKITVEDPQGVSTVKAIVELGQFDSVGVPVVAQCMRTGRRYSVSASVPGTQELYLDTTAQLVAGDYVELFYVPVGTSLTRHYYRPSVISGNTGRHVCALKVGTVTGASLRFQALDPSTSTVGSAIFGRNSGMTGLRMARSTVVATPTTLSFNTSTNVLTMSSTTGIQAGDWGQIVTSAGAWVYQTFVVMQVLSGTTVEIAQKYSFLAGAAFTIPNGTQGTATAIFLREQADVYYVTKHTGSASFGADPQQNIWVDNITNVTAGNYVEMYFETGGFSVSELFSPTALAGYPAVASTFERRARDVAFSKFGGEPQLFPMIEPFFDSLTDAIGTTWTGSPTLVATSTVGGKHGTNALVVGGSILVDNGKSSTADDTKYYRLARLLRDPFAGSGRMVFSVYIRSSSGSANLSVFTADGEEVYRTVLSGLNTAAFQTVAVAFDPSALSFAGATVRAGSFFTQGFVVGINTSGWVDALTVYWAPDATVKSDDNFSERGGGPALWSRANEYLALYSTPPRSLSCSIIDLWQLDRTRYAGKRVVLGAPVSVYNVETSSDLQARITAVETAFLPSASAKLTVDVNTMQDAFTRRLVET